MAAHRHLVVPYNSDERSEGRDECTHALVEMERMTTLYGESLGSRVDEERSQLR